MTFAQTLHSRFRSEWINSPRLRPLYEHLTTALRVSEEIDAKRAEIAKSGTYSEKGLDHATRTYVAREAIPVLKDVRGRLDGAREATAAKRATIALPKPDPGDVTAAMMRQEIRTHLRTLSQSDLAALLMGEPDLSTVQAVFEAPDYLTGLEPDLKARIERRLLEARHPETLRECEEQEECLELVKLAMDHAVGTIRTATGFEGDDAAFDDWMAEASGETREAA